MPTNKGHYMRDYYRAHSEKWNNPTETGKRVKRNQARAKMVKKYGKSAVKGKDVGHKNPLRKNGSNKMSNLRIESIKKNRNRHK